MKKKSKKLLIVSSVILAVIIILGIGIYFFIHQSTKVADGVSIAKMWDSNGNEIRGTPQAMILGQIGVKNISLYVAATNNDTVPLTFTITSATPTVFQAVLPINTPITISPGGKQVWTSGQVDITPYINQTISFCTTISGTSIYRQSGIKSNCYSLNVYPDSQSNFEVSISFNQTNSSGGTNPTQTCGNGIIEGTEICDGSNLGGSTCTNINQGFSGGTLLCNSCTSWITSSCTTPPVTNHVKYRVADITYGSGNAIGYTTSCGSTLTQYGKTTGACTTHYCDDSDYTFIAPGSVKFWYVSSTQVCACEVGITSHTYAKSYTISDSDAGNVNPSSSSITPANEVAC